MGPPGGGRNEVTARLVRHCSIVCIDAFDDNTLKKIFTAIVDWHFGTKEYEPEIIRWARPLVSATLMVYREATALFLPTPAKSHYVFNLRDFARVIRGLLLIPPSHLKEPAKMQRLWIHEAYRVFYDRLVDESDRGNFFGLMSATVSEVFKADVSKLLAHLSTKEGEAIKDSHVRALIFGDYMDPKSDLKVGGL
jgi:dynein heavy chain